MNREMYWKAYGGTAAEIYERHLVPAIFGPWAEDLVALAGPKSGERVLDVACGTGIVTRLAAQRVGPSGAVVGLDLNPGMLAVARALARPPGTQIDWREASANAMPFPDAAFDLVLCQQGLQFFPDRLASLREMRRVLVPGGRLAVSVWRAIQHSPGCAILATALGLHIGPEAATFMQGPFALGSAEELRALITGTGFGNVVLRPSSKTLRFPSPEEFVGLYVAATPLAGLVAQANENARAALIAEVSAALRSYVDTEGLAFPIATHFATAHA